MVGDEIGGEGDPFCGGDLGFSGVEGVGFEEDSFVVGGGGGGGESSEGGGEASVGGGEDESGAGDESVEGGGGGSGESLLKTRGVAASGGNAIFLYGYPAMFPIKNRPETQTFSRKLLATTNHCT